jgi:hypothetical protein
MTWNKKKYPAGVKKYNDMKKKCQDDINKGRKSPNDYMKIYKEKITKQEYEHARAITDILETMNYYTYMTHDHIACLNEKRK